MMVRLAEELSKMGVSVEMECASRLPLDCYELVHCFNLCTPNITEPLAREAGARGKAFVIHACQEDFPLYLSRAMAAVPVFRAYLEAGQPRGFLEGVLPSLEDRATSEVITSGFILENAAAVFVCGPTEGAYVRSLHGPARLRVTPYGASFGGQDVDGALFERSYGVKEFVLCVGRLEIRKNQLMLLAALEHDDVPLVFADAGFTYQPEYEALCRGFKRKAPTIFTGRLSEEMLVSAYGAARVHCLPSWYELPGLASLEAAAYGCNVVASSWGALPDYLGCRCWYCQPDSPAGIRGAVFDALESPRDGAAAEIASRFTWEKTAAAVLGAYSEILDGRLHSREEVAAGSAHG